LSLRSKISGAMRAMLRRTGRDVVPYDELHFYGLQRRRLMSEAGITLVLDVGANLGQTGAELREAGYTGKIVSFEPLKEPFGQLSQAAAHDGKWMARQCAVGDRAGSVVMNVSGTHWSSSILPMADRHTSMVPTSAYVGQETVQVMRLDDLFGEYAVETDRVFLKVDTQGYEAAVLRGAEASLPKISLVQLEVSFVRLYEQQPEYHQVMGMMDQAGFDVAGIEPGFFERKTCRFLQADVLFARRITGQVHP
jgi:FkbM family methyltransferase